MLKKKKCIIDPFPLSPLFSTYIYMYPYVWTLLSTVVIFFVAF